MSVRVCVCVFVCVCVYVVWERKRERERVWVCLCLFVGVCLRRVCVCVHVCVWIIEGELLSPLRCVETTTLMFFHKKHVYKTRLLKSKGNDFLAGKLISKPWFINHKNLRNSQKVNKTLGDLWSLTLALFKVSYKRLNVSKGQMLVVKRPSVKSLL